MTSNSYEQGKAGPIHLKVPPDDTIERLTCNECGFINYINPKVIVGAVCTWGNKFLLCKRAIEPRIGFWNELIGIYNVARLSQVHLIYRAKLIDNKVNAGPESQEVRFFSWDDIPWIELAFPSVHWALNHYKELENLTEFSPRKEGRV